MSALRRSKNFEYALKLGLSWEQFYVQHKLLTFYYAPAMIMAGALSVTPVRPSVHRYVLYVRTSW